MKSALSFSPINPSTTLRTGFAFLFAAGAAVMLGALMLPMLPASRAVSVSAPAAQVSEASRAQVTEGLLRQTAEHLSKMQRGESIGGFPGFEPPDDDEKYRRKIKEQHITARDVNDWVKQINNFLKQIVDKSPGMTLEEILRNQGLTSSQIDQFVVALRNTHTTAEGMESLGVNETTVKMLESLMRVLRVQPW